MREYDYLDFNFSDLPEIFHHTIDGVNYRFRLYYNGYDDSFHVDIWDQYNIPIVNGEKLVYGMPLWNSVNDPRLPLIQLEPLDDNGNESTVSALNFPVNVKLEFVDDVPNPSSTDDNNIYPTQVDNNDYGNDHTN